MDFTAPGQSQSSCTKYKLWIQSASPIYKKKPDFDRPRTFHHTIVCECLGDMFFAVPTGTAFRLSPRSLAMYVDDQKIAMIIYKINEKTWSAELKIE